jgi:hypothetical protein
MLAARGVMVAHDDHVEVAEQLGELCRQIASAIRVVVATKPSARRASASFSPSVIITV